MSKTPPKSNSSSKSNSAKDSKKPAPVAQPTKSAGSKSLPVKPVAAKPAPAKPSAKAIPAKGKPAAAAKPAAKESKPKADAKSAMKPAANSKPANSKAATASKKIEAKPVPKATAPVTKAKDAPKQDSAKASKAIANPSAKGGKAPTVTPTKSYKKMEPPKAAPPKPSAVKPLPPKPLPPKVTEPKSEAKKETKKEAAAKPEPTQGTSKTAAPAKKDSMKPVAKSGAKTSPPKGPVSPPPPPTNPKVVKKIREFQKTKELKKDLSQELQVPSMGLHSATDVNNDPSKDRLVLVVRDSFWLHASWEVTRRSVERAQAAMAEAWHTVHPILRLLKIDTSGTTNNSETIDRDIEIHGGVRNWYISVTDPPFSFRVLLGFLAGNGRFHELARSNIVTTPVPGSDEAVSTHWADIAKDAERIFALSGGYNDERETKDLQDMFEEHLKRPMGAPALAQFGSGAEGGMRRHRNFHFDLDAEMVVFGSTHPDAYVTLGGEPVKVRSDGTFSVRVPLPDRRQVLPATACTRDGVDEQTIVIAVERNTKVMEPLSKENEEGGL